MDTMSDFYKQLETDYRLTTDVFSYLQRFESEDDNFARNIRFESILLNSDVEYLLESWPEETRCLVKAYCEDRLTKSNNIHLKTRYGWNLWALTGKQDYKLLNAVFDDILCILKNY